MSADDEDFEVRSDSGPWAVVPGWVINADINDKALRLYALLSLFADGGTRNGGTTRNRKGLAARLGCSVDTIDRASASLEEIGAIKKLAHFDRSGDQGANRWIVYRVPPGGREFAAGGGREDAAPKRSRPPIDPDPSKDPSRDQAFDAFWSIYPRKEAKKAAADAFKAALKRASAQEILAGAMRYRDDPNRDQSFTAHATTWLRADRWGDAPLPQRKGGAPRPGPSRFSPQDNAAMRAQDADPNFNPDDF
jgi:hypothetical protein